MKNVKKLLKKSAYGLLVSLFATYAIYEKFMLPELQIPMIVSIIFVACFFIVQKTKCVVSKTSFCNRISYAIFAFFMVAGDSFKKYDSFFGVFGNPFRDTDIAEKLFEEFSAMFGFLNGPVGNLLMVVSSLCKGFGYYFIITFTFELAKHALKKTLVLPRDNGKFIQVSDKVFGSKAFLKVFLFFLLAWLPYLIIKFPGSVAADAVTQINQFLSNRITTHHPFFTTLLFGSFVKFGVFLGSRNMGVFLYVLVQYVFMAASFAYCIVSVDKLSQNHRFVFILVLLFGFSPIFPSYATTIVKDSLYCTFFALYITQIILLIHDIKTGENSKRNLLFLCLMSVFLTLVRNNGIYVVALTTVVVLVYFLFKKRKQFKQCLVAGLLLLLPLVFYAGYDYLQYDVLHLEKGSIKEALSLPFQQTARYVKEHPEDVSAQDAEVIDRVLDYENLATLYNPIISDPVKGTYKGDDSALGEYFKVWFKHLQKHPLTYVEATIGTNYFAFYPDEPNIRAYIVFSDDPDTYSNPVLHFLRIGLLAFTMGLSSVPVISCIINPVFYVWIFIYLFMNFLFKKKRLYLLTLVPMFVQLLTVLAGPAVFNHPRYIYPLCCSIPFVVAYLLPQKRLEQTTSQQE